MRPHERTPGSSWQEPGRAWVAVGTLCALVSFPSWAAAGDVLIGLRDANNHYRTIWLGTAAGSLAVNAVLPGLIVPREDGFWRMDVEPVTCGAMGQYTVDELRIRALDSGTVVPIARGCESMARISCGEVDRAGPGLELERWISYAGPTHFAEIFRSVRSCEGDGVEETGHAVHALDRAEQDVPIAAAFAADRMDALESSARSSLICETDDLECIDSQSTYGIVPSSGWGIVRAGSQWSVLVSLALPGSAPTTKPLPVVTDVAAPQAIVGSTESLETLASSPLPEGDRAVAPDHAMAIVRSDHIEAYRLVSGNIEGAPIAIPVRNDEQVVMIEWASGSRAASWEADLREDSSGAPPAPPEGIGRVAWIQGCWQGGSASGVIEEQWTAPRGDSMLGVSRTLRGGVLADYELMVLREEGEGLVFEAHPSGLSMVPFAATTIGEQSVVFENPQHDFPQRIGYERRGEDLLTWIEGPQNGEVARFEFPYRRATCAGENTP